MRKIRTELLDRANVFRFSRYWGTWSRVLTPMNGTAELRGCIELNLSPINPGIPESWDARVRPIIFRHHFTSPSFGDDLVEELPDNVRAWIVEHIGEAFTARLIETDWISLLDLPTVIRGNRTGGGISFAECSKESRS